jgi:hypothetical protein
LLLPAVPAEQRRLTAGLLDEPLKTYRDDLAIVERLAAADRSNTPWQRDLAVSYARLASVYLRLIRQAAEALATRRKGRDIMSALVAIAPSNAQWKKDLAWLDGQIAGAKGRAQEAGKIRLRCTRPVNTGEPFNYPQFRLQCQWVDVLRTLTLA